jgi:hypothetical protein
MKIQESNLLPSWWSRRSGCVVCSRSRSAQPCPFARGARAAQTTKVDRLRHLCLALLLLVPAIHAQPGFPFTDESLHYTINWPSGLSLGEATFTAHRAEAGWTFDLSLNAAIPGFPVADSFSASATNDLCSIELQREISHAGRKTHEKTTFDQQKGSAHRATVVPAGGGESDFSISSCARDALTYSYYARRELGQGRVPEAQTVYFGSGYSVKMTYTGPQTITVGNKLEVTDRLLASVNGPKSDFSFEVFYARDAARTPVELRVPLPVGTLSIELVR